MSDSPGHDHGSGDQPDEEPTNPFKGTPFEALFGGLAGGLGSGMGSGMGGSGGPTPGFGFTQGPGPGGGQMPDFAALLQQMQALMKPHDGPVNWAVATDMARKAVASGGPDPSTTDRQAASVADAVQLADHWLDETTDFPSGVTSTAAWSRAEWIEQTMEVWKVLVEPVAASAVGAVGNTMGQALPEEARQMAGPLIGMLGQATGAMVASQVGTGLGGLAGEVLSASDVGLPLGPVGRAALVPANVGSFAADLDVSEDDVLLYLALREAAHQRLFAHVPWLRDHLVGAVADYASGIEIDTDGIEQRMREIDPTDLQAMQSAVDGGLFDLTRSPAQQAALERLEVTLALVEGWVDEVVGQATAERMPAAGRLQEAVRRRRAAGGPAEQAFAALVGLELRPRRLRDASTLWGALRTRQGTEARDGVWMHPHLLPTATDLDDPLSFREDAAAPDSLSEEDFDAGLRDLLEGGPEGRPKE